MAGDCACETFGVLSNTEQDAELNVLLAGFHIPRDHPTGDNKHTVMSAKTMYTVYNNRRA